MPQISTIVRNFIINRMLDTNTGFNYWLPVVASDPAYENAGGPFTLVERNNLFRGAYTHSQLLGTFNTPNYPLVIIYTPDASTPSPTMNVTTSEFSGVVRTRLDWISGFSTSAPPVDPDSTLDMIEDAMIETFNRSDYYGIAPPGTTYNGEMTEVRGALSDTSGGPNWIQISRWDILFRQVSYGR